MFSGIVEECGIVKSVTHKRNLIALTIAAKKVLRQTRVGDSICVDGVCLTVSARKRGAFCFDVMLETIRCTTLKYLKTGSRVNLERALKVNSRLGGHFVLGHVDGVGTIGKKVTGKNYVEFRIAVPKDLKRYIVPKGCIAIDGISLTVGQIKGNIFSVYIIPHTLKVTTLGSKETPDQVNIEADFLAKYILKTK